MLDKKGLSSITALLLLVITLLLLMYSTYTFITHKNGIEAKLETADFLKEIYLNEEKIKIYTETAIEETIMEVKKPFNLEEFKEKLREKNNLIIGEMPEISQVSEGLTAGITLGEGQLIVDLEINLEEKLISPHAPWITAVHVFRIQKTYEINQEK